MKKSKVLKTARKGAKPKVSKREARIQNDQVGTMMAWRKAAETCKKPKFRVEVTRWTGRGATRNSVYCFCKRSDAELCYSWWIARGGVTFIELAKYEQLMSLVAKYAEPEQVSVKAKGGKR